MKHARRIQGIISLLLILVIAATSMPPVKTEAASVNVIYKGERDTYYKRKNYIYINGKKMNLKQTPIFLKYGTYMGPLNEIYKKGLGAKFKFLDKKHQKLQMTYGKKTLVFTNQSRYVSVNGKSSRMGGKAIKVKFTESGKVRWMVPLLSVSDRLKVDYNLSDGVINIDEPEKEEPATTAKKTTVAATTKEEPPTVPAARKIVLVLDAGHGGSDSGANGCGLSEKNLTLAIVLGARAKFLKNSRFKVYYSRVSDTYPSLDARCKLANVKNADLFIAVHINSYKATSRGTETLYNPQRNSSTKKNGLTSYMLASAMQAGAVSATGFPNRGLVSRTDLRVLNKTSMPACLIEYGFISNKSEAKQMNLRKKYYGEVLYNSVISFLRRKGKY